MSEQENVVATEETPKTEETQPKMFTQEELDRIVGERVKREREKYSDYEAIKAKLEETDSPKSELEQLRERAEWVTLKERVHL